MTKIAYCGCEHSYQDKRYGPGLRVHNKGKSKTTKSVWNCTVCGKKKEG